MLQAAANQDIGGPLLLYSVGALVTIIFGLVAFIAKQMLDELKGVGTEQKLQNEKLQGMQADSKLMRAAFADHMRWSKAEHRRHDDRFRRLGE